MKSKLLAAMIFSIYLITAHISRATVNVEIMVDLSLTGKTPLNASIITNTSGGAPADFQTMTDEGGGYWKYSVTVADASKLNYYFYFWDGADNYESVPDGCQDELWYRSVTVGTGGSLNRNHIFSSCITYSDTARVDVTFEVDMAFSGLTSAQMLLGTSSDTEFKTMNAISGTSRFEYTVALPSNSNGPFSFDDDGSYPLESVYDACKDWPVTDPFMRIFNVSTVDTTISLPYSLCSITSYSGTSWSNGIPDANSSAIVEGDLTIDSNLVMGQLLTVNENTVTVNSGKTLEIAGTLIHDGSLVVNSGASLITYASSGSSGVGVITINRDTRYGGGKYSFVGSPVNQDIAIKGSNLGTAVYKYNETTNYDIDAGLSRWEDALATTLIPGVGYAQAFQESLNFTGIPNTGEVKVTGLTNTTGSATNTADRGWNLVSNPYPAAIDLSSFLSYNEAIDASIYLWDDHGSELGRGDNGDYLVANTIGSVSGPNGGGFEGYIGSVQGFFVRLTSDANGDTVVFQESMRVNGNNTSTTFLRKSSEHSHVKLTLKDENGQYEEILIGYRATATQGIDRLFDARKLSISDTRFFSLINDEEYAIQGVPQNDMNDVKIGYNTVESGILTIEVADMVTNDHTQLYLVDKYTKTMTPISKDLKYVFSSLSGYIADRFSIVYDQRNADLSVISDTGDFMTWTSFQVMDKLHIKAEEIMKNAKIKVFDLRGNNVLEQSIKQTKSQYSIAHLNTGIYVIYFENGHYNDHVKILINQ